MLTRHRVTEIRHGIVNNTVYSTVMAILFRTAVVIESLDRDLIFNPTTYLCFYNGNEFVVD